MDGKRGLGALGLLGAVVEQRHARVGHAHHHASVGAGHVGELHEHLGRAVGVGAEVDEGGHAPADAGQGARERGSAHALDAAHDERARREDGARGARREEGVGLALAHGPATAHDARVALLAHGLGGVLGHADDLRGHERLGARVLGAEGRDLVLVACDQRLEVLVGLERPGNPLEHHLGRLVPAHRVNDHSRHVVSPFVGPSLGPVASMCPGPWLSEAARAVSLRRRPTKGHPSIVATSEGPRPGDAKTRQERSAFRTPVLGRGAHQRSLSLTSAPLPPLYANVRITEK